MIRPIAIQQVSMLIAVYTSQALAFQTYYCKVSGYMKSVNQDLATILQLSFGITEGSSM